MKEDKTAEIRDLINKKIFLGVLRTDFSDGSDMITIRYLLGLKFSEYKKEEYK